MDARCGQPVSRISSVPLPASPESENGTDEIRVAVLHLSLPAWIASGRRRAGVGEGNPRAGVGAGERSPPCPRALSNRSSNGLPSMRTESPPRGTRSLAKFLMLKVRTPFLPSAPRAEVFPDTSIRLSCPRCPVFRQVRTPLCLDWTRRSRNNPCLRPKS